MVRLILYLPEKADVLNEPGLDVFVIHELAEDVKLFPQELIGKIDLTGEARSCLMKEKFQLRQQREQIQICLWKTHCGVHDARAVRPNRVCDVTDVDGIEVLVVTRLFYEDLQGKHRFRARCKKERLHLTADESYLVV